MAVTNEILTDINDDIAAGILTDRQARFVFEYMKDQNASAAARRCGYAGRSAANQGNRLLGEPAVRDRIRMEMREMLAGLKLSVMDLIRERMRAAFFRNGPMFGPDRKLLPIEEMPADFVALFDVGVEMRKGEPVLRLKQPSRERALAALEKVHDKLERLDEKYYDQLGRAEVAPEGARPSHKGTSCVRRSSSGRTGEGCDAAEKPHHSSSSADRVAEKPHHVSSSAPVRAELGRSAREQPLDTRTDLDKGQEKPHHSSASKIPPPAKHHHLSSASVARSVKPRTFGGGLKSRLAGVIGKLRRKPEARRGMPEQPARAGYEERHNEACARLVRRGGQLMPDEPVKQYPPGFIPPWERSRRPLYAIGHDECSLDD